MLVRSVLAATLALAAGPAAVALATANLKLSLEDTDAPVALVVSPEDRMYGFSNDIVPGDIVLRDFVQGDFTITRRPGEVRGRLSARDDVPEDAFGSVGLALDVALINFSTQAQSVRLEFDYALRARVTAPADVPLDGSFVQGDDDVFARATALLNLIAVGDGGAGDTLIDRRFDLIDLRGTSFGSRSPAFFDVDVAGGDT